MNNIPYEIKNIIYLFCDFDLPNALIMRIISKEWNDIVNDNVKHLNLPIEMRKRYFNFSHSKICSLQATKSILMMLFPDNIPNKDIIYNISKLRNKNTKHEANFVDECFREMIKIGYTSEARWIYNNLNADTDDFDVIRSSMCMSVKRHNIDMIEFLIKDLPYGKFIISDMYIEYNRRSSKTLHMLENRKPHIAKTLKKLFIYKILGSDSDDESANSD
jgi:hypothetical protein